MKKLLISMLIALMFVISSCGGEEKKTDENTEPVEKKMVVEATGVVKAQNIKNIIIDFPAFVDKVHVKNGKRVWKGESLVSLRLKDFEAQISTKEHELNIANIQLKSAQDRVNEKGRNSPNVKKLLNDLKFAEDQYKNIQGELAKKEQLYNSGAVSKKELDDFKKEVEAGKKGVEDIKFSLDNAETIRNTEANEIRVQKERVESTAAELNLLKEKLTRGYISGNNIISDVEEGIVFDIGYFDGDLIGDKKLLSILDLGSVAVEANVPEEFIKDVKMYAEASIYPLADSSKSYRGRITKISDMAINQNGQTLVPVYISIENMDEFLKPNFNVDVEINMEQ